MKNITLSDKIKLGVSTLALSALVIGCATTDSTIVGGLIGAGTGAIIGHQSGETGEGAAIGAAAGALGGYLLGESNKEKYCSTGGEIFSGDNMNYCPRHGTRLRYRTK